MICYRLKLRKDILIFIPTLYTTYCETTISIPTGKGILVLLFKKSDSKDINNYRPIILLPVIYKIWATIISKRISLILNLLTNEQQCAYKTNRSTQDLIYFIKTKLTQTKTQGQLLMDLSKAFGRIDRNTLRWILYRKGLPLPFIKTIIQGHTDTLLCSRHKGIHGPYIENNIGVFQGSPISPQMFIIYSHSFMGDFEMTLKKTNITQNNIIIRDQDAETKWTSHQLDQYNNKLFQDNPTKQHIILHTNRSNKKTNYAMFADDTSIDINNIHGLEPTLNTYNNSIANNHLLTQWLKVELLTKKKFIKTFKNISTHYLILTIKLNAQRKAKSSDA